mmetsp:Transcript_29579/g.66955  ORF Transcript_29579/g.66955 Transcript_29579/m.66955 type:complete len:265 (-) Transcript_29579:120-914(-)
MVRTLPPRAFLCLPRTGHRVLTPHHAGLCPHGHIHSVKRERATSHPTPPQHRLANHLERALVEALLVELAPQWAQPVGVSTAVVRLKRPRDLHLGAGNPRHAGVARRQSHAPHITQFRVGGVDILRTEAAGPLSRDAAACHAAGVNHRGIPWSTPRRVVEEVLRAPTFGGGVDSALRWVANSRVHGRALRPGGWCLGSTDGRLWAKLDWLACWRAFFFRAMEARDGPTGGAITLVTSDRAAVRKPEAGLPIGASEVAIILGCGS